MKQELIANLQYQFNVIAHTTDDENVEFWYARDLQGVLGYDKWENFFKVIEKAKISCENSQIEISDHFLDVRKMVEIGSNAQREIKDIVLTRYACYLIAQNGDSSKEPIAFAQTYFALQTRKQELIEQRIELEDRLKARKNSKTVKRNSPKTSMNVALMRKVLGVFVHVEIVRCLAVSILKR